MTNKEAIEILNDFIDVEGSAVIGMTSLREAIKIAIKAIEERPQGEWIFDYIDGFGNKIGHCSECKYSCEHYDFCPNCGVDMRGKENECKNNT